MALQLEKTLPTGFVANYWKVNGIEMDFFGNYATVKVSLYKDKEARLAGNNPVYGTLIRFSKVNNPFTIESMETENCVKIAYDNIKQRAEFNSAIDC